MPTRSASSSVHFPVDARPAVLVRHSDDRWYSGRLHAWLRDDRSPAGRWLAVVSYHVGAGMQFYLCLDGARVQPSDRAQGPESLADTGN